MKLTVAGKKNLILAVVGIVVVGALLSREYKAAGLIVSLVPVGCYILADIRRSVAYLVHFRNTGNTQRVKLLTYAVIIYIFVKAIITGEVSYFLLLVMLAVDYIIYDNQKSRQA